MIKCAECCAVSNMAVRETSLSSAFTNRQSRTLCTASLYVMILPVGRLTHFQETYQTSISEAVSEQLSQEAFKQMAVGHKSKMLQIVCIKSRLLQEWYNNHLLGLRKDCTCGKRGIDSSSYQQHQLIKTLF